MHSKPYFNNFWGDLAALRTKVLSLITDLKEFFMVSLFKLLIFQCTYWIKDHVFDNLINKMFSSL